jgi:formiminoglutamate deiminase
LLHCELAWLGGAAPERDVLIEIAGGAISSVTAGVPAPPRATRLAGITLPGLANAHSHAFHRALRGRTQVGDGTFWTWREVMYGVAATLDPDRYHALARATFAEMVLAGVTCVGEFHYLHHAPGGVSYADPNAMGAAVIAAASDAGLRLTLLDTCYLHGGIGTPLNEVQQRYSDGNAAAWMERVELLTEHAMLRIGAAIHSVRAVDPDSIAAVAEWSAGRGCPLHAHVSEQPAENDECQAAYGCSPSAVLAANGAVTDRFSAVHATHIDHADVALLAAAGASVCMCPTTERDLADGIGPTPALRAAGVAITLGSDSNAIIDLFEEARAVELDARLASGRRGNHDAVALLTAATSAGHRSLGWPEVGRIAVGAPADLVTVGLRSVRTAGTPTEHALEGVVFAATAADVTDVFVAGQPVVTGGRHRTIDVESELDEAIRQAWSETP